MKFDDDTVTFTLAADVCERMDEMGVVGGMDVKLVEMIERVFADSLLKVMRGCVECIAFHWTPFNSTNPPEIWTRLAVNAVPAAWPTCALTTMDLNRNVPVDVRVKRNVDLRE